MSSINFTGLSNIKVGSADCTVYLGANKIWPLNGLEIQPGGQPGADPDAE